MMPSISALTLSVTGSSWTDVTLGVAYTVTFSPVERFLAANGLSFEERVQIIGDDPGEATDLVLHTFQSQAIVVAPGPGSLAVNRNRSITVARGTLNEDPGSVPYGGGWGGSGGWTRPDADEMFARVEVAYVGLNPGSARADSPAQAITVY